MSLPASAPLSNATAKSPPGAAIDTSTDASPPFLTAVGKVTTGTLLTASAPAPSPPGASVRWTLSPLHADSARAAAAISDDREIDLTRARVRIPPPRTRRASHDPARSCHDRRVHVT